MAGNSVLLRSRKAARTYGVLDRSNAALGREHRAVPCAATGHSVWWLGFSGVELRWPHRLQVCVPLFGQHAVYSLLSFPTESYCFLPRRLKSLTDDFRKLLGHRDGTHIDNELIDLAIFV